MKSKDELLEELLLELTGMGYIHEDIISIAINNAKAIRANAASYQKNSAEVAFERLEEAYFKIKKEMT